MEISKYFSKQTLISICIFIIIVIILRIIYIRYNPHIEGFYDDTNANSLDLLSKIKSFDVQNTAAINNPDNELSIIPWSNSAYNTQNPLEKLKPISFYKPILSITDNNNNINKYAKLGDIVSQNYNPPKNTETFLLIKKNNSDIKPPTSYNLIVDYTDTNFNTNNYAYSQYVNDIGTNNLPNFSQSLAICNSAFTDLDAIINKNILILKNSFSSLINNNLTMSIDNKIISSKKFITNADNISPDVDDDENRSFNPNESDMLRPIIKMLKHEDIIEDFYNSDYSDFLATNNSSKNSSIPTSSIPVNNSLLTMPINSNSQLVLPAGINGLIEYTDDSTNTNVFIDISIPASLDSDQNSVKKDIINKLPSRPYASMTISNILITKYPETNNSIFTYIPVMDIINYIKKLCDEIKKIYVNNSQNVSLLNYLNLSKNLETIDNLLTVINKYSNINNINNINLQTFFNDLSNANINTNDTTNLLGLVLYTIKNMMISYYLTYLTFKPSQININSKTNMKIKINSINNDFISNISSSSYNITNNLELNILTNKFLPNISNLLNFIPSASPTSSTTPTGSSNSSSSSSSNLIIGQSPSNNVYLIKPASATTPSNTNSSNSSFENIVETFGTDTNSNLFPIQIYNPIAPEGYTSLGHIFCNKVSDLEKIKLSNNVACVPSHCVKEMRPWVPNDKIFEYNKNNKYWAIYFNPYIGTFISTNTNKLPDGKVCKVVACVVKNNSVDKLQKADSCIRQYYNLNKQSKLKSPISSRLVSDKEEVYYLSKIKTQSDSIAKLRHRSQQIQMEIDKANIINREMNKHKLQDYTDTQKRNINIIMKKLKDDKNKIQTNINIPENTLNELINLINSLPPEQQEILLKTIDSQNVLTKPQLNQILNSCPQYNLDGLVKKSMVTDVCYGCDIPK